MWVTVVFNDLREGRFRLTHYEESIIVRQNQFYMACFLADYFGINDEMLQHYVAYDVSLRRTVSCDLIRSAGREQYDQIYLEIRTSHIMTYNSYCIVLQIYEYYRLLV